MFFSSSGAVKGGVLKNFLVGIVDIAGNVIEAAVFGGELKKSAEALHGVSSTVAAATEEFSSTAQVIAQNAGHVARQSMDVAQSLDKTITVMTDLQDKMTEVSDINQKLAQATQNINELLSMIEEVAEQTNLLSLNASIEAARAGEHGRGFAIVADEVRKLSVQTQKSAETIRGRARAIQQLGEKSTQLAQQANASVQEGVGSVRAVSASSRELDTAVSNIQKATQEQQAASGQLAETVQEVLQQAESNRKNVELVLHALDDILLKTEEQRKNLAEQDIEAKVLYLSKVDHLLWKKKMVDFEYGRLALNAGDMGDHTMCRLGKWYYSEGKKSLGTQEVFRAIEQPHKEVHRLARQAVEMRARDSQADIAGTRQELNAASNKVVELLDALIAAQQKKAG